MAPNFRHRRRSQTSSAPRRRRAWMFKLSSIVYDMHTRCLSKIRDKKIASVLCSSRRVLCRRDELAIKSSYVWGQQDLTLTPPYTGCFLFANRMRAGTRPTGGCPPWALISHAGTFPRCYRLFSFPREVGSILRLWWDCLTTDALESAPPTCKTEIESILCGRYSSYNDARLSLTKFCSLFLLARPRCSFSAIRGRPLNRVLDNNRNRPNSLLKMRSPRPPAPGEAN